MHHLLTGVDPRGGIICASKTVEPDLSEGIEIIIDKCVQPAAENRYQSCSDLLYDLEHQNQTRGYKKKQKRKLLSFVFSVGLSIIGLISGFVFNNLSTRVNNNNYDSLVSVVSSTSYEDKINSYKQAIEIYPSDATAYIRMLEAYENEGKFGKTENDEFLALFNAHKADFDSSNIDYAELNYKIGMMYFNYYTDEDGSYSFSNRVQKAYPFFEVNFENKEISPDFKHKELSDCYYQICYFYRTYILNSVTIEEASKESYDNLFETINSTLTSVENAAV